MNLENLELTYIVQALDNVSPNIIEHNGKQLNSNVPEEELTRRKCAYKASDISLNGHKETRGNSLRVFYTDSDFLIEAITEQLDNAGRMVPVVVYGRFPEDSKDWILHLQEDIERFLDSDDTVKLTLKKLTLKSDLYNLITKTMQEIWHKKKVKKSLQDLAILLLACLLLPLLTERILQETQHSLLRTFFIGLNNYLIILATKMFIKKKDLIKIPIIFPKKKMIK